MMTLKVILQISTIAIIAITSNAVKFNTSRGLVDYEEGCPYLPNGVYFVTVKGLDSALITGCVYMDFNYSYNTAKPQSYTLWFENEPHFGPHCRRRGLEYVKFYCTSHPPSASADIKNGLMLISQIWPYQDLTNKTDDIKCALYEKIDHNDMTLKVAISKSAFCDGLSDMLYYPEQIPRDINGSLLMKFNINKPVTAMISTETSTEIATEIFTDYVQTMTGMIVLQRFSQQKLGNRSIPIYRKIRETKDDGKRTRRALQMTSYGDDIHGAVMDLTSYNGLKSNINKKDGTTKDKNWLRRPLEINQMQLRRRRSKSNVLPTSKTDAIVLTASNPFTLLLANRVHNKTTGAIKPLGLWDQIMNLFN